MVSLAAPPAGAMAPPPTPKPSPMKRPTLHFKRDSSYMDTDDESGLSASTKKLKVAFDPNVDVRILPDWDEKSFDLVKEEVNQGIEQHVAPLERRDDTQYTKLLQLFENEPTSGEALSSTLLIKYITAIDSKVRSLSECGKLVIALLDLSWLGRSDDLIAVYCKTLCHIASAHIKFVPPMMERLVPHFTKLPASLGRLSREANVSRTKMFARLHLVLKTILRQVPSASVGLLKVLSQEFPNDLATTKSSIQYQKHLLRLSDELPELQNEILALLAQRLVNIDVQIQHDVEDLEDEAEEKLLHRTESKGEKRDADDSDDSDNESVSESEETTTEEEERMRELKLKVSKMDGTLDLLFAYYKPLIEDGTSPRSNKAHMQLISHFTTFILPSRTRHAQFLLFRYSQTSAAHVELLLQRLIWLAVGDTNSNTNTRLTACAYISSFVARGSGISKRSVQHTFRDLCEYLENSRQKNERICRGPDKRNHAVYYAITQALLYIFCFRWRDLVVGTAADANDEEDFNVDDALAEDQELIFLPGIKETFHNNIYSRLNPLKVCSPEIVGEFARIANHLRFLFVFPLLETNKRIRLGSTFSYYGTGGLVDIGRRETAWDRKTGEAHHRLEAYFPFDPYYLPKSKHWVADSYNSWKAPPGMKREDEHEVLQAEDEESESEEEEVDSDGDSVADEVDDLRSVPPAIVAA